MSYYVVLFICVFISFLVGGLVGSSGSNKQPFAGTIKIVKEGEPDNGVYMFFESAMSVEELSKTDIATVKVENQTVLPTGPRN